MKHLRVTIQPDPDAAPAFFEFLAESPDVTEARVIDWNMAAPGTTTLIYAVDGDAAGFKAAAEATSGVQSVQLSATDGPRTYALVQSRQEGIPTFSAAAEAIARAGLVVSKPLVIRDGKIHSHAVGEPAALQASVDDLPEEIDVQVDEVGQFPCARASPTTKLSERQQEALEAAVELGYYDRPRNATHEDVAAELGCAPATASEHLQKAETKLIRSSVDEFGPSV